MRFGPMKPVGLFDPRARRQPYAVVQLRQDNIAGDHYSLVGFQTQLKWGEQERVLRLIPGLEQAEFVRFGMVHRNTYVNGPAVLTDTWQVRRRPSLFLAGQMSGVEGYVESAASGLLAGAERGRARLWRSRHARAADDGDWRAGVLCVACKPGALRAEQHHVRHHAGARSGCPSRPPVQEQAREETGRGRPGASRSSDLDAWTHVSKNSCSSSGLTGTPPRTPRGRTRAISRSFSITSSELSAFPGRS